MDRPRRAPRRRRRHPRRGGPPIRVPERILAQFPRLRPAEVDGLIRRLTTTYALGWASIVGAVIVLVFVAPSVMGWAGDYELGHPARRRDEGGAVITSCFFLFTGTLFLAGFGLERVQHGLGVSGVLRETLTVTPRRVEVSFVTRVYGSGKNSTTRLGVICVDLDPADPRARPGEWPFAPISPLAPWIFRRRCVQSFESKLEGWLYRYYDGSARRDPGSCAPTTADWR